MMTAIHIKNIGIIEDVTMELKNGFQVLTGETGAGKSLIIDSLNILAGDRFSKEMIRKGEECSFVEASFYLPENERADEGNVIVTREIHANGRNACKINGRLVTVSELKEFMRQVIDIHGQQDSQKLLDEKEHLVYLDQYRKEELQEIKEAYESCYRQYCMVQKELKDNYGDDREKQRRLDLLRYQQKEMEEASLQEGEEERLEETRKQMIYADKIRENLGIVSQCLDEQAIDALHTSIRALEKLEKIDGQYEVKLTNLKNIYYDIQEFARDIEEMQDGSDWNENDHTQVEERLDLIRTLKRKYGSTISEILTYEKEVEEEINQIENLDEFLQKKKRELASIEEKMQELGFTLHEKRVKIARELERNINQELEDLEMKQAEFQVEIVKQDDKFFSHGMDQIRFLIKTNVGNDFKPLVKTASGGELSRIMLALKTVFAQTDEVPIMIFDEIDTGMSGRAAKSVSEKLSMIAQNHQIFVITHLAMIAAKADHHFYIYKEVENETTKTKVKEMQGEEIIYELARMSAGEITKTAIQHVLEMKKSVLREKVCV